jgi:hypothetical protein
MSSYEAYKQALREQIMQGQRRNVHIGIMCQVDVSSWWWARMHEHGFRETVARSDGDLDTCRK